jgi:MFS family permease
VSSSLLTTIAYFVAFIVLGMVVGVLGPTLPGLAAQTQSTLSAISFLFIAKALGGLFGAFMGGWLYDRRAGHPIMLVALIMMALLMGLIPWSPTLWIVSLAFFLLGMAGGTLDIGGNTLIVWLHGHRVGSYMNGLHFCFGIGAFLAPLIVAMSLSTTGGIQWAYWSMGLLMLPIAFRLIRLSSQIDGRQRATPLSDPDCVICLFLFRH